MTKRTKVQLFEQIRKAHAAPDSPSIRELSRTFGVHRRVVRQALASAVPPARKTVQRAAPSLDPWKSTIGEWHADKHALEVLGALVGSGHDFDFHTSA